MKLCLFFSPFFLILNYAFAKEQQQVCLAKPPPIKEFSREYLARTENTGIFSNFLDTNVGRIKFKVKVGNLNSVYIALTKGTSHNNDAYTIWIGRFGNTKTTLTKGGKNKNAAILVTEFISLWLEWNCGLITMGYAKQTTPILSYADVTPIDVNYVLFDTKNADWKSKGLDRVTSGQEGSYYSVNSLLDIKFKGANDLHVGFFTKDDEIYPVHEVTIGGSANTLSTITSKQGTKSQKVIVTTVRIVSPDEYRKFRVERYGGYILVYRENSAIPFMSWKEIEKVHIDRIGIMTGWGTTGMWKVQKVCNVIEK